MGRQVFEDHPDALGVWIIPINQILHAGGEVPGRPPAEADMRSYLQTTAPSVHHMVVKLEDLRLIKRTPGKVRSIELLLAPEHLPVLRRPSANRQNLCAEPLV